MCGITGIFAFNEIGRFSLVRLQEATKRLEHRGQDAQRLYNDFFVGLGHRRLSILDLSSAANQPMSSKDERYTIVFNGEIYNFAALRKEFLSDLDNDDFETEGDTEVLLQLYIRFKEKCLEKLNGFFAFAVYDNQEQSIFIARDRTGIKPLLYYSDDDKFVFSSEMVSLMAYRFPKKIDWASLRLYFSLHYIPAPHTIFENVYKLPAGHYLKIKKKEVKLEKYYEVPATYENQDYSSISYEDSQKELVRLLEESVKLRLISDVPIGSFLSGGTDSSAIVALATRHTKHLNTFSIGYKDEPLFDETSYANLVAKKFSTNHIVFTLSNNDIFEAVFDMLPFLSEPFADSSAIPFYVLSKHTKQTASVALSGDGGDELFAGYNKYLGEYKVRNAGWKENLIKNNLGLLKKLPKSRNSFWGNKFRQLHRFAKAAGLSKQERYWFLSSFIDEQNVQNIFQSDIFDLSNEENKFQNRKNDYTKFISESKKGDINEMLYADMNLLLPNDMLHKADQFSMAHALEVRVPFLDHNVVNFAFQIEEKYKIDSKMKKRIVQDAFKTILPAELYNRSKHGFDVPLAKGFQTLLKPLVEQSLDRDFIQEQGIFSPVYTENLKQKVKQGTDYDQNHVWAFIVFQEWWKKYDLQKTIEEEEEF
ncbi:MAG: asparagine synthase (glutamine-hydrolyzing) [Flexibacter sp. CG_4_10_14_3_um_filter_32_15]|nr:MAG: asparagine synthase (glutamine-hydrolyzing) [Flexibacter sp. CG_4_10_14_3_um_filter_32_15]